MRIMAWIDCTELIQLCRVCKWWQRLYPQAGHWVQFLCVTVLVWRQELIAISVFPKPLLHRVHDRPRKIRGSRRSRKPWLQIAVIVGKNRSNRANELMRRDTHSAGRSGIRSFSLSASDLELRHSHLLSVTKRRVGSFAPESTETAMLTAATVVCPPGVGTQRRFCPAALLKRL